jgi:uncharacterized membrane protein YdjX (TVP38/TMEM64 family)
MSAERPAPAALETAGLETAGLEAAGLDAAAPARPQGFWARHWQKVVAAALWTGLIAGGFWYMRANDLTLSEAVLAALRWVQTSPLAPLLYILLYALRPLTLFSATLLTVAGGFLFGPLWGIFYTVIAANVSASVAFVIGRFFGQDLLAEADSGSLVQRYAQRMRDHSFETVLIMRFIYIPYDLVSYLSGLLRIRYLPFILATALGSIPGTIAFVLLGASASPEDIEQLFLTGELPSLDWRVLALSVVMFVASLALARLLRRKEAA